jgi:ketopantoate reductase
MRIAVVGAGGVGGAFGAALADGGAEVTFIARGAHLAAMKSKGLRIEAGAARRTSVPTQATDDPEASGRSISCCSASSCGTSRARTSTSSRWSGRTPR